MWASASRRRTLRAPRRWTEPGEAKSPANGKRFWLAAACGRLSEATEERGGKKKDREYEPDESHRGFVEQEQDHPAVDAIQTHHGSSSGRRAPRSDADVLRT